MAAEEKKLDRFQLIFKNLVAAMHLKRHNFSSNACINVKPEGGGGGTLGRCGAFDFSEDFLVKIPTIGPQNLVKSDQNNIPRCSINLY